MLINIAAFFFFRQLYCDEEWCDGERGAFKREHEYFSQYEWPTKGWTIGIRFSAVVEAFLLAATSAAASVPSSDSTYLLDK